MLSHPLLVEAVTQCFQPVAIYNNVKGYDAQVLERYRERTWNNPVVRYLDAEGADLIPRKGGIYTLPATAGRMLAALQAAKRPVPGYLRLLALDRRGKYLHKATFAMF